ncbi:putative D,D-dipeptide transport ATP-binding protein DdpD [Microbacterium azadirachtae]|uniref:Putative D,D-dipeptide transport ATP-binding protein DdpD n=1 Tax=Microbacterium azadirachtae TaxID=582680 RepID=A0A0F0L1M4_9MICO|nr:ABC transporter ATP-binding protein [Microbacterium azadirachtae]KJL26589.1 putative D,D-dipeptide transport ATP-binding protein DdpD [Microbacterium azadirachtae]
MSAALDATSSRDSARTDAEPLVIEALSITVRTDDGDRPLLDRIDLQVGPGEIVGLVGESGSGKSVTSRSALGLFPRGATVDGSVLVDGIEVVGGSAQRLREVRRTRAAMIFQDPRSSVNAMHRVGDFLTEGIRARGVPAANAHAEAVEILAEVGIRDPETAMRRYPHEFSGGMLQRIVIAAAVLADPRLILADEATTALDVTTQAEVISLLERARGELGTGLLFVTHDLELAAAVCDRIYVMYAGRVVESGAADEVLAHPQHPYTAGLLSSNPQLTGERRVLSPIPGRPRALTDAPSGCAFRDRCPLAVVECTVDVPALLPHEAAEVACVRPGEAKVAR